MEQKLKQGWQKMAHGLNSIAAYFCKVLLNHSTSTCLYIVCECLCATTTELSSRDRDWSAELKLFII